MWSLWIYFCMPNKEYVHVICVCLECMSSFCDNITLTEVQETTFSCPLKTTKYPRSALWMALTYAVGALWLPPSHWFVGAAFKKLSPVWMQARSPEICNLIRSTNNFCHFFIYLNWPIFHHCHVFWQIDSLFPDLMDVFDLIRYN